MAINYSTQPIYASIRSLKAYSGISWHSTFQNTIDKLREKDLIKIESYKPKKGSRAQRVLLNYRGKATMRDIEERFVQLIIGD